MVCPFRGNRYPRRRIRAEHHTGKRSVGELRRVGVGHLDGRLSPDGDHLSPRVVDAGETRAQLRAHLPGDGAAPAGDLVGVDRLLSLAPETAALGVAGPRG